MHKTNLSKQEQTDFVDDGFVILRDVIPTHFVRRARELITSGMSLTERRLLPPRELATHPDVVRLFNETCVSEIMRNAMGPYPEVVSCQIAVTPARNELGGRPSPHVDGSWAGSIPTDPAEIDPVRGRPLDAERYFGKNDEKRGTNDGLLWQDPNRRISLGSYTALVGIALNNQLELGHGQFAVLRGMHEEVEKSFQMQRDSGSVIGPEGAGWPRLRKSEADGRVYLNGLPKTVREKMSRLSNQMERREGWPWPELTPVCLAEGDAVIALHACPHTATPNLGPNPRMNLYFRIRRLRENNPFEGVRKVGHGVSDHPDRGYFGQFLDYPESYDAWQTSIDKLCDHWSEWNFIKEFERLTS